MALKRELVVQLFTRDGPFWEAVRDVRDRWGVEASAQLPPHPVRRTLSPPGLPDPQKELEEWLHTSEAWRRTLLVIVDAHDRLAEAGVALRSAGSR